MIAEDSMTLGSIQEFIDMLQRMVEPIRTPAIDGETWQAVTDILQEMERGYFASSAGPDGTPWAPLKPYTVQKKGHATILRETWELMNSLTGQSATSVRNQTLISLEFGTNRPWAWVHQNGDQRGRIPPRPFIGMTEDATKEVVDTVADAAVRMMFGA
jgi:phage gpG-like protein